MKVTTPQISGSKSSRWATCCWRSGWYCTGEDRDNLALAERRGITKELFTQTIKMDLSINVLTNCEQWFVFSDKNVTADYQKKYVVFKRKSLIFCHLLQKVAPIEMTQLSFVLPTLFADLWHVPMMTGELDKNVSLHF